ncbi:hypothetical protein AMAG_19874 [Allomyces macrogynus ATCC 38327]|uniref:Uncharacterized protein n=1 Tax=Allomyces macrogynus (strain ATCC 38327) TaxID=578462 RepID=A0A0L0T246_ALLM3|nr:hypothetical protein AMAG_19874 [Allomyces macrogynus ATCC 38327]|eukprot:KNE68933.1 hypothetical protein AMAG_19874 [Allomyces macrogynus ATCC 38327]
MVARNGRSFSLSYHLALALEKRALQVAAFSRHVRVVFALQAFLEGLLVHLDALGRENALHHLLAQLAARRRHGGKRTRTLRARAVSEQVESARWNAPSRAAGLLARL